MNVRILWFVPLLLLGTPVHSTIIQMDFTGSVYDVTRYNGVSIGDSFNFTFQYDAEAPTNGTPIIGTDYTRYDYQGTTDIPISITGTVGDHDFYVDFQTRIELWNSVSGPYDRMKVLMGDVYLDDVYQGANSFFNFDIWDHSGSSFDNTKLPLAGVLNDGAFDDIYWSLSGFHDAGGLERDQFSIDGRGSFTAHDVSVVSAPPAMYLFVTGLLGLGITRRYTHQ